MAPLNSTAFVIAWCDETANDISFAVYATDGTVLRSVQDVDTSVSACAGSNNVVDVDSFNSTHIVIAYYDEADEDASYITGDWSTMNVTVQDSIGDSDTGAGTGSDVVSVAVLDNQTYVIGWLDDGASDERYRFEVRDIDGTQIGSDTTLSGSDVGGLFSRMGAAAFNSSHFVFAWKDYLASDITYKIYQVVGGAISNLTQEIDVDTTGSNTDSVDIATFNSTHFVILFADDPVHDVLFEIHDITGTRISGDDVSIDADDGGSGTIDVAAINSSAFVAVFGDDTASNSQVTIYDVNENQLLAPIAFEGTSETDMGIMSFKHPMGIELCDDNFIVASSTENWYANKTDGTTWNGICNSAGNAPVLNTSNNTNFSISTPNLKWNNATDGGYPIATLTYNLQIDNDSDFSSVTYENNTIIETVTPTNHTVNTLLDALYYWRVRSITSLSLNSSWSSTYIFRADTTGPTITITDPGDTEELISNVSINLNFTVADALLTVDTCWFNLWNSTDYEIGNTTITSCGNTTFNTSNSGTFNVTLYANDTLNNINLETNEFTITLSAPAITLSNPTDTEFLNSGTDVLFNFTASDSNGLGNCALYHNSTATFALNLSNSTSVVSGTPYNFTQNFTDSDYLWNIFCNDTLGNGRFSTNNRTFTVDSTDPNITNVSITTTQGSQTISFDVNVSDVNLDSCIYSIFNSSDAIDGLNDGVSVGCNSAGNAATVASFGTYNLQISASDLASNTNSTNTSFTTEDTSAPPAEGGGVTPPSVTQRIRLPSTNFSIVTTNFGDKMDFVLAKGSLRPREKDFILVNQDIEPIIIDLVCDTESLLANETTEEGSEINICDFVQFENETLSLTPNEIENTIGRVRITTPTDAKFGDQYNFNILALSNVSETEILFAKLSVTSRVPLWGKIFSWKKIPLSSQTAVSEVTGEEVPTRVFPLIFLALFVSFSLFVTVLVLTRKAFPLAGFALSVIFFVGSFTGIIVFL